MNFVLIVSLSKEMADHVRQRKKSSTKMRIKPTTFSLALVWPRSSVGGATEDQIRRSWVRFPPRSKISFLCLGLTLRGNFIGPLIYSLQSQLSNPLIENQFNKAKAHSWNHYMRFTFILFKGKTCITPPTLRGVPMRMSMTCTFPHEHWELTPKFKHGVLVEHSGTALRLI